MLVYWTIFACFSFGAIVTRRDRSFSKVGPLFYVMMAVTLVIVGLRWQVGPDWNAYLGIYNYAIRMNLLQVIKQHDPGFYLVAWLLRTNDAPFWALNLLMAFFFLAGLTSFVRTLPNPWLAVTIAVPYLIIVVGMNLIRQAAAMGFVFLAIRHLGSKPLWKSIGWSLIGSLFHASAIIVALLIGISYTKNRLAAFVLLTLSAIPMYFVLASTFDEYIQRYNYQTIDSGGVYFRLAINAIPALLLLATRKPLVPPSEYKFWRNLSFLSLIILPLPLIVHSTTSVDRLSMYAVPLQLMVLSAYPEVMSKGGDRILNTALMVLYSALTLFTYFNFGTHARYYSPYHWVISA